MKYFTCVLAVLTVFLLSQQIFAKAAFIPLNQKVAESNLIARIKVLSISKAASKGEYRSIAKVRVIQSIKGVNTGQILNIDFDNGLECPNVLYAKGDDCLIFATHLKNGHYGTYNTYYGKFDIQRNKIAWWENSGSSGASWNQVVAQIRKYMQKAKQTTAS